MGTLSPPQKWAAIALSLFSLMSGLSFAQPDSKLLCVTGDTWSGNLGGLSGADSKCNTEAKSRGYAGQSQAVPGFAGLLRAD